MNSMTLILEILKANPSHSVQIQTHTEELLRILKNLTLSRFSPDYDRGGVIDPFLQQRLLKVLRHLNLRTTEVLPLFDETLGQILQQTEKERNPGCAVLYEAVLAIFDVS
jgi:AP-1 complex subunit gamma-1